jgi:hypothetical protein
MSLTSFVHGVETVIEDQQRGCGTRVFVVPPRLSALRYNTTVSF